MNPAYAKKSLTTVIALSLVLSGCLLYGAGQASAAGSSSLHKGFTLERYAKLQDLKYRWRKQTEEARKGSFPIVEEAAALLGLEANKLQSMLKEGQSIADIAKTKGLSEDELTDKLLAGRIAKIDEALKSGKLTQERADAIKQKMRDRIGFMVRQKGFQPENCPQHEEKTKHQGRGALQYLNPEKMSAIIGIPKDELIKELKSGKSLAEIAESKGISKQQLIEKIKDELTPLLEKSVESKKKSSNRS